MSRLQRAALWILTATGVTVGFWALAAPRSFYDDFPGLGRVWVAVDGPFNEHLVRDVGALNLALAFVAALALVTDHRLVARAAGGAALVYGIPHLTYHALHLEGYDAGDAAALVTSLALAVVAAGLALGSRDEVPAAGAGTLEG